MRRTSPTAPRRNPSRPGGHWLDRDQHHSFSLRPATGRLTGTRSAHRRVGPRSAVVGCARGRTERPVRVRRRTACGWARPGYRSNASLCQVAGSAFFVTFLVAECGRRLAAPPGRSSSLLCGRSTWTCGFAGGGMAAIEERPALPGEPGAGSAGGDVVWWPDPGVACPKSRRAGCEPAALGAEPFPACPPGSSERAAVRCASARSRVKIASLTCRFSERMASFGVLPSAIFLS